MRRLATTLSALAFSWTSAVTGLVLLGGGGGIRTGFTLAEGTAEPGHTSVTLMSAHGVWLVALLLGITVLAGVPLGVAISYPKGQRLTNWTVSLLLLAFAVSSGLTIGPFYLPGVLALLAAAFASGRVGEVLVAHSSHPTGRAPR